MKILVVVHALKSGEGISEWVYRYYENMTQRFGNISVDILVESGKIDDCFKETSSLKFLKFQGMKKGIITYIREWSSISKNIDEYNYIHFHYDNLVKFLSFLIINKHEKVIIHSHNSRNENVKKSRIKIVLNQIGKKIVKIKKFNRFACSDLAAQWLFNDLDYIQINNGIELDNFKFNDQLKKKYQAELGLTKDDIVYGHIGRMMYQKNHEKLIDIFYHIKKKQPNAKLLLIGKGELESKLREKIKSLNLVDSVIILGYRSDVKNIINVFDYCIFPSRFEGLPIALVEAQANGIPIFYSDRITKEVELLDESFSYSIDEKSETIALKIIDQTRKSKIDREKSVSILKNKGYEQSDVIEKLYNFYKNYSKI